MLQYYSKQTVFSIKNRVPKILKSLVNAIPSLDVSMHLAVFLTRG